VIVEQYIGRQTEELKRDKVALMAVLKEAGGSKNLRIRGNYLCCPFCSDTKPSAGIYTNGDGLWFFKCQRSECGFGGSIIDVLAKADGLDAVEVFRRLKGVKKQQTQPLKIYPTIDQLKAAMPYPVEDVYQYTNPTTGKPEMIVIRLITPDGKDFRQARPVETGFVFQAPAKPWPLYNRKRIEQAQLIIVVEGERCVHALHKYGFIATTSPCGAGKAEYADWTPLKGKLCILWQDADPGGIKHMQEVAEILQPLAKSVHIIEPANLGLTGKEDVEQYIERQNGDIQSAILEALNTAKPPKGAAEGVGNLIKDAISGKQIAVPWPWPILSKLTKSLIPENVVIICGGLGASKSFKLLEAGTYWHKQGIKIAIYELEESKDFHLLRSLAQKSKTTDITDLDWIRNNPDQAWSVYEKHKSFLDSFGVCMKASPDTQPTLAEVANWVQERAKAGCRVIGIDPVTAAAHKSRNIWEEDNAFLHNIKRSAVDYRCSVILITHPVKSGIYADITHLAGGAAYQRFAQTILWLESHEPKTSKIRFDVGSIEEAHNRTLHILKARHGPGQGVKLAYNFQVEGLTLDEIGIIVRR